MRVAGVRVCSVVASVAALALVLLDDATAQPAEQKDAAKEAAVKFVRFDHLKTDGDRAYTLRLANGEAFQVKVEETCPDLFSYEVRGIVREERETGLEQKAGEAKPLETKVLPVVHDEKYGGYLVAIRRVGNGQVCTDGEKLKDRTLMISTPKMTWDLSFSGGFTLSTLNSPHYFLGPHPTEAGKKQVQEDATKVDDANLGVATYVHLYHQKLPWLAGTFGLGLRDQNKVEYMLGAGIRFSDKATLNAGILYGPVTRLKDGVNIGAAVTDDNVLTDLPTRTQKAFFVGISYSFIDVRGKLQEPFAGSKGASGETGTTTKSGKQAPGEVCVATLANAKLTLNATAGASGTVDVSVKPDGCGWKVTEGVPAWASVQPMSGNGAQKLTITAKEANATGQSRTSTVDVGGAVLTITQDK